MLKIWGNLHLGFHGRWISTLRGLCKPVYTAPTYKISSKSNNLSWVIAIYRFKNSWADPHLGFHGRCISILPWRLWTQIVLNIPNFNEITISGGVRAVSMLKIWGRPLSRIWFSNFCSFKDDNAPSCHISTQSCNALLNYWWFNQFSSVLRYDVTLTFDHLTLNACSASNVTWSRSAQNFS